MMRRGRAAALVPILLAVVIASACGGGLLGKRYEYEEDVTLDLDGSATVIINASIPALIALRGLDLDPANPRVDRDKVRTLYSSPVSEVIRVSRPWRRSGRRFVQIRVETQDIRKLSAAAPFAWSQYELTPGGGEHTFRQTVGASALKRGTLTNVGWDGSELVAFRLHLPSRIIEHNSRDVDTDQTTTVQRGNIVAWEQHLADRLDGKPVTIAVRISSQSILYRTLWLFAGAFGAAVFVLAALIWWTMRRGDKEIGEQQQQEIRRSGES
jgi:hypothetical protein